MSAEKRKRRKMEQFLSELDRLYAEGNNEKTERYLLDTLQRSRDGGRPTETAGILNELSGFYRGISRYSESLRAGAEAMAILEKTGLSDTPQFATMMVNYAGALRLNGQTEASRERFLLAKNKLEQLHAEDSYQYVSLLNNLALTCQDLGSYEEAISLTEEAVRRMRLRADREDEVPTGLTNLATLYLRKGEPAQAGRIVGEALEAFRALPERSAHEAAALSVLGTLQYSARNFEEAEKSFSESVSQTEAVFGKNVDFASAMRSLALTERALRKRQEAVNCQQEAVSVLSRLLGSTHARTEQYRRELEILKEEAEA